jgi:hypothetical protein
MYNVVLCILCHNSAERLTAMGGRFYFSNSPTNSFIKIERYVIGSVSLIVYLNLSSQIYGVKYSHKGINNIFRGLGQTRLSGRLRGKFLNFICLNLCGQTDNSSLWLD